MQVATHTKLKMSTEAAAAATLLAQVLEVAAERHVKDAGSEVRRTFDCVSIGMR
jgi:hypothetical protein